MLYNFVSVWKANIFYIKHALSEMIYVNQLILQFGIVAYIEVIMSNL